MSTLQVGERVFVPEDATRFGSTSLVMPRIRGRWCYVASASPDDDGDVLVRPCEEPERLHYVQAASLVRSAPPSAVTADALRAQAKAMRKKAKRLEKAARLVEEVSGS